MGELGVGDMLKATYDSNKNDRIEKDALGIALDKLLKGAGAGADPTEVDPTGNDEVYGLFRTGADADKPAAGVADRFYWATDTKILYRDTGAAWEETARGETATRLAQLFEKAHGSLTGVTAAQHHAKTIDASELTAGILALARLSGITNTQIAAAAAIAESKLSLDQGTQALFDKIVADIAAHAAVAAAHHARYTDAEASAVAAALIAAHAGIAAAHHAKTVIGDLSPIAETDLALDQGTQALFDKIVADIAAHAGLDTGVHGVGASTVCSETEAQDKVDALAALAELLAHKDALGGYPALDANGFLLVKGTGLIIAIDGSDNITFKERTNDEWMANWHREAANTYVMQVNRGGAWTDITTVTVVDNKITTHKADASAHHAKYTDAEAQTTVKANVEVGDLKAPTKALAMNSQDITEVHSVTSDELHGTTYWGDIYLEDVECLACHRKFRKGDKVVFVVNVVKKKYFSAIPIHLRCSEGG